jgi:hypothetical protein
LFALSSHSERRAHPAGRARLKERLPLHELEVIAAGLAHTALGPHHIWVEEVGRRYTRLLGNGLYDAWLIAWMPSSGLDLHDHGGSDGAIAVVRGCLLETHTDLLSRHPLRSRIVEAGEILAIPAHRVHEVSNPGPDEAFSVHVYSPPLDTVKFYDPSGDGFLDSSAMKAGDLVSLQDARPLVQVRFSKP